MKWALSLTEGGEGEMAVMYIEEKVRKGDDF